MWVWKERRAVLSNYNRQTYTKPGSYGQKDTLSNAFILVFLHLQPLFQIRPTRVQNRAIAQLWQNLQIFAPHNVSVD